MREMTIMARVTARAPVDLRSQRTAHALATIADDTGEILLNLWRNQINEVQVGDSIILRNAFARKHMGKLEVSTWADIEKPKKILKANTGIEMSQATLKVSNVKQGQRGLILEGKISRVSPPREIQTRYGPAKVATATLEDDTGSISLNLWRTQIDLVKEGDRVRIENAFANAFRGDLELNIGSDGKIVLLSKKGKQSTVEQPVIV
jgi:ssDNA-binding replication factor A large subunit